MTTKAIEIIIPTIPGIFRTIFLYVGQGESILMVIPDKEKYKIMLIDCNIDKKPKEVDIVKLLKDLLGQEKLDVFLNTHPHTDHLDGIKEVFEAVGIKEIWHSGHEPKGKHKNIYKDLKDIMKKIGSENIFQLLGSTEINKLDKVEHKIGDIDYQVLSPAEYVCDDIEEEDADIHYNRIHEQSGVIKFIYGAESPTSILITGDSDLNAWKNHITDYHKENLKSEILSASHHGSRTFFKNNEDDEPYLDHIQNINPYYVIISSPPQDESEFGHPHEDAIRLYSENLLIEDDTEANLFHLGSEKYCLIVDIYDDGKLDIRKDFDIIEVYGFKDNDSESETSKSIKPFLPITRIEKDKPMG